MTASDVPIHIDELLAHRQWVAGLAVALTRDQFEADDIVQQTWLAALRHPPRGGGSARGWLGTVVRNAVRERGRAGKRRTRREAAVARPDAITSNDPAELTARAELHATVSAAVVALVEPYRRAILLRHFEGLPVAEVARRMDAPLETTRARLRRGRAQLRERLACKLRGEQSLALLLLPLTRDHAAAAAIPTTSAVAIGGALMTTKTMAATVAAALFLLALWWGSDSDGTSLRGTNAGVAESDVATATPLVGVAPTKRVERRHHVVLDPPPEPESVAESPPDTPPEIVRYVVRDVFDSTPVSGLSFALSAELDARTREAAGITEQTAEGAWVLTPTPDGSLRIPASSIDGDLHAIDTAWRVAECEPLASDEESTLWVYRMVQVSVTVRAGTTTTSPLRLERVAITATAHGANSVFAQEAGDDAPLSEIWLRRHGLFDFGVKGHADADGRLSFEIPRVSTITVRARVDPLGMETASGWRDAAQTISDEATAAGSAHLELTLERGYEISGRLVDDEGHPVEGVRVSLHVVHYIDMDEISPAKLALVGHNYTLNWDPSMPKAIVDYKVYGRTDADGRFSLISHTDGELTISFVPTSDQHIENVAIGRLSGFDRDEDFTLRSSRGEPAVKLVGAHGASFAGQRVTLTDTSYGDIQPSFSHRLGSDAKLPSRYLVKGHTYWFLVHSKRGALPLTDAVVTWNGETELEIKPLRMGGNRASESADK